MLVRNLSTPDIASSLLSAEDTIEGCMESGEALSA
jgi:hypothetical protein